MCVTIGVDPHKASCTAAVLDERGELVAQQRFAATPTGSRALGRWAKRWPGRRWAVEGASGLGRTLAQQLVRDGEPVVDVPAKLAARVRLLSTGHGRKSDPTTRSRSRGRPWRQATWPGPPRGPHGRAAAVVGPPRRPGASAHPDPEPAPCAAVRPAPRRRQAQPGRRCRGRPAGPAPTSRRAGPHPPPARRRPGRRPPHPGPADHRGRRTPPGRRPPVGDHPFRRPYRHRPDRGLQRRGRPPPAVTSRQSQAQPRPAPDRDRADPPPHRWAAYYQPKLAEGKSPARKPCAA
jgi:hypothetical protein